MKILTQIYEIQTPSEAEALVKIGVDHIGSVLLSRDEWKVPTVKETVGVVQDGRAKSSMIPLFSDADAISRMIDYYRPDIVHFCEDVAGPAGRCEAAGPMAAVQEKIRIRFPEIGLMRSLPVAEMNDSGGSEGQSETMQRLLSLFDPISDWFLTDTVINGTMADANEPVSQPVSGFVGITGELCNWDVVASLVRTTKVPVILAGGISPENVYEGVLHTRPAGVDSCTRTNADDGGGGFIRFQKDMEKVAHLVSEVRRAEQDMK
ncbi:MAG: hypothetical protein SWH68_13360 [Thermodesulfobacteriota bacterium]|nr:hypothetical protein [Thermodesulfobacteriota bacterium]